MQSQVFDTFQGGIHDNVASVHERLVASSAAGVCATSRIGDVEQCTQRRGA